MSFLPIRKNQGPIQKLKLNFIIFSIAYVFLMKKLTIVLMLMFLTEHIYSQLPYLNASTGNMEEFPIDKDTSMYGFYNNSLFKTDKNQNVIWAKNYSIISFSGLLLSKTGSLFFYGDKHFGKMDMNGNILWTKSIDALTTGTNTAI